MLYEERDRQGMYSDPYKSSGMIDLFDLNGSIVLKWEGDSITALALVTNHAEYENIGPVDGLCAPAFLIKCEHDLYTPGRLWQLEHQGIVVPEEEYTAAFWHIYMARPDDLMGVHIALSCETFTREDIVAFAQSIQY